MALSFYSFIIFLLPLALLGYYAAPKRFRHLTLTIIFYGWVNPWSSFFRLREQSERKQEARSKKQVNADYLRLALSRPVAVAQILVVIFAMFAITAYSEPSQQKEDDTLSLTTAQTETVTIIQDNTPAAVPVVTAKEAEKHNEDAIAYAIAKKEKREPFYRFYQDTKLETVCFQGTIRAISSIPDPKKNDYDNCLYALFVEIDALLSDVTTETEIACEAIVNVPIMKDKQILQDNKFVLGDKVLCICSEYDTMPQSIQEIQLSDDIQLYEKQQYYSLQIKKIPEFQMGGNRTFSKREITVIPIQSFPKDEKAVTRRKERIQNEIIRIEKEVEKHGGSFESWKKDYKVITDKYKQLCSANYKAWIGESFFAADSKTMPVYKTAEYIKGILPYKKYLEENNIDLIVVRIPTKGEFARCVLTSDVFEEDPEWCEHLYNCLKNDIEIIDPMPEMWNHRFDFPMFYFYNDPTEGHPYEGQAFISAMVLSEVLKRYSFKRSEQPLELEDYVIDSTQPRFFWPDGNIMFNPQDNVSFKRVVQNKKSIGGLEPNTGSPFIFVSNSFFYYPDRIQGASVPAYTAFFIQTIPDWYYQNALGNSMLKNLVLAPELLNHRYAVVMVGHPNQWNNF